MQRLPSAVQASLSNMTDLEQAMFVEEYKRRKKSIGTAYLCWLVLGLDYGYLHKWGLQFFFWITLGGMFIWWLINFFTIPSMVRNYNKDIAVDVLRSQKIIMGSKS